MKTLKRPFLSSLSLGKQLAKENSPVWSCNEWDPLEEVIVGVADNATVPLLESPEVRAIVPDHADWFFKEYGGKPFPKEMIDKANAELDYLSKVLTDLGITVRRPQVMDFDKEYETPWWKSRGLYAAMPRDDYMVFGDILIEAPMAWRSRYFESFAFHPLMNEYFEKGARWLVAPKSTMTDGFYDPAYNPDQPTKEGRKQFVVSEKEIAFDAADFVRFGKDVLVQKSNVTNAKGIEWVRRHVAPDFRVHEVEFDDTHPMHIDTTIVPLAPGKLLINPMWVKKLPSFFDSWDILEAPPPTNTNDEAMYFSSDWLTINTLSVDEKRVIVEAGEQPLIEAMKKWGFEPIAVPFRNFYPFGGAFHCATLDVRRRGGLKSYF